MAEARDGAINADDKRPYFDVGPLHCDNADWTRQARERIPEDLATGCYPDFDSTGVKNPPTATAASPTTAC